MKRINFDISTPIFILKFPDDCFAHIKQPRIDVIQVGTSVTRYFTDLLRKLDIKF